MESIGTDKGITVRYAKNLQDITCEESWNDVVTKLMPVGKDGILLPETYIESTIQYAIPYCKAVSFEQDINEEDYASYQDYQNALIEDLRAQATEYVEANSVPQVSYTLSAHIDDVEIGDVVEVIDERLNINLMTNVIAYDYDCILEKYTTIEFGNYQPTIMGLYQTITTDTQNEIALQVGNAKGNLTEAIVQESKRVNMILTGNNVQFDGNRLIACDQVPTPEKSLIIDSSGVSVQSGTNYNLLMNLSGVIYPESIGI